MTIKKICCVVLAAVTLAISAPVCSAAKPVVNGSLSSAVSSLKSDKNVRQYTVSHNSQKIAIVRKNTYGGYDFYVMTVAGKKQYKVGRVYGNLNTPQWSYDDKYISVDDGTGTVRNTYFVTASTLFERWKLKNTGSVWSGSSDYIAMSIIGRAKSYAATDLIVLNMNTIKYKVYFNGDTQFSFKPIKWNSAGITVQKTHLNGGKKETFKFNPAK